MAIGNRPRAGRQAKNVPLVNALRGIFRRSFLVVAILIMFAGSEAEFDHAQETRSDSCIVHVLFLGNSYTYFNDLPSIFSELAKAGRQCKVDARMVTPGGARLKDHWDRAEAHEALNSQKWDYVVLQDQSTLGVGYYFEGKARVTSDEVFLPYAEKWAAEIVRNGAKPVFYLTWARKDTPDDQAALNYAYIHAAKKTDSIVAPVGMAWQQVRQESPTTDLYYKDGSHPSQAGSYLAACVLYAAILHENPTGLPSHITGLAVNLETEKLEPEKIVTLVDLPRPVAGHLQAAAWQVWQSLEKNGGYFDVHPAPAPTPIFVPGEPLLPGNLAGTWSGKLLFYPAVGPVEMVLQLQPDGGAWKGHLSINYPVNDFTRESFDISDLQVGKSEFTFTDPKSAGVDNWRVKFRGALVGTELEGTAETKPDQSGSPPIVVVGDWTLHKQNP